MIASYGEHGCLKYIKLIVKVKLFFINFCFLQICGSFGVDGDVGRHPRHWLRTGLPLLLLYRPYSCMHRITLLNTETHRYLHTIIMKINLIGMKIKNSYHRPAYMSIWVKLNDWYSLSQSVLFGFGFNICRPIYAYQRLIIDKYCTKDIHSVWFSNIQWNIAINIT